METFVLPALSDNYIFLLRDGETGETAVVDPAQARVVRAYLDSKGWELDQIWNTHHHYDHVGGNAELCDTYPKLTVIAPEKDPSRFPRVSRSIGEGDAVAVGRSAARVLCIPGHTRDHVAYWFEKEAKLFCGDTLFSVGCGRVFCGSHASLFKSLRKLAELPDETMVYCAHEYTLGNCTFAMTVDAGNPHLQKKKKRVEEHRGKGEATVPASLGEEKLCNPFLRARTVAEFTRLRDLKDRF